MQHPEFANPKLRHLPIEVRSNNDKNRIVGGLLFLSTLLIITTGIITALVLAFYRKGACSVFFLMFILEIMVINIVRLALRYSTEPQRKLLSDSRDPVLYLRPFDHDLSKLYNTFDKETPEEKLAAVLDLAGPVLAVGKPEEEGLPLLGATRVYLRDGDWHQVVQYLMAVANLVVISAGTGSGLLWELKTARHIVNPQRLFVSFLHWRIYSPTDRQKCYESFSRYFEDTFRHSLPIDNNLLAFVYFDVNWTPRPIEIIFERPGPMLLSRIWARSTPRWGIKAGLVPILTERGLIGQYDGTLPD
jgi:hypothetical protein